MNLQIFTRVKAYSNYLKIFSKVGLSVLAAMVLTTEMATAEWKVDFSRRTNQVENKELSREIASEPDVKKERSMFDKIFSNTAAVQEIVILNTEQGFIPSTVRVKEGLQYRIVVVNVNEKAKNISFVLDAFSEHHATFYGKMKSFYIDPKKEGIYTFISPETSAQGRLIVHPGTSGKDPLSETPELRSPASR